MRVHFGVESLRAEWLEAVACVGTFDGVHLGHAEVVGRAVHEARGREQPAVVVTFDRHPAAFLNPEQCPPALGTLEQQLAAFGRLGAAATVVFRFDAALAAMPAAQFLDGILRQALKAGRIVVGHDFAFGHGREGNPDWLADRIPTVVVPPFEIDGGRVSSSRIRSLVAEGNVELAARFLGRAYGLGGVVVAGQRLGRTLGYPTINLARTSNMAVPADGVYAARAHIGGKEYSAAASIGCRPTVGGTHRTVEAHLLDYRGDTVYGQAVWLEFVARLRAEVAFATVDDLVGQMKLDVAEVRRVLS